MIDFWTICKNKDTKMRLVDVKLNNDKDGPSLALTYLVETLDEVTELHIPRVVLTLKDGHITIREERRDYCCDLVTADVGFGMTHLLPGDDGSYFTTKVIKTKTKEMTLEEIEKTLGHKVKIVNK